jgi:spore germination protein GerM
MKKWLALVVMILLLLGGSWWLYVQRPVAEFVPVIPKIDQPDTAIPLDPATVRLRQVTLFVADPSTGMLIRKVEEVPEHQDVVQIVTQTVQYLIKPEPETLNLAMPEGTELLNVFMSGTGTAYINLNRHVQDRHPGGITAELTTITALVNTVLFNFKEITQVQILVEGAEIETLAGHIDCRKPFTNMFEL